MKVWTVGHSTRSAEEFRALLAAHAIEHVADVRRFPASRRYPHFAREQLADALTQHRIGYTWLESLGGRRTPRRDSPNSAWRNAGFRGYADYMLTEDFAEAFDALNMLVLSARTAIMCSEAVWWRCHRALLSDLFASRGATVLHILDEQPASSHPYSPAARLENGVLTYDPARGEPARLQLPSPQPSLL